MQLIFDGAGTKWIGTLSDSGHKYSGLFASVRDRVSGACEYCAKAFQVADSVESARVPFLGEYDQHPSLRKLVTKGYTIITF